MHAFPRQILWEDGFLSLDGKFTGPVYELQDLTYRSDGPGLPIFKKKKFPKNVQNPIYVWKLYVCMILRCRRTQINTYHVSISTKMPKPDANAVNFV